MTTNIFDVLALILGYFVLLMIGGIGLMVLTLSLLVQAEQLIDKVGWLRRAWHARPWQSR